MVRGGKKFIKVKLYESRWGPSVYAMKNDELEKTVESFYIIHLSLYTTVRALDRPFSAN